MDELRVTCQLCTSTSLWVGTADGTLLIYDIVASPTSTDVNTTTPTHAKTVTSPLKLEVHLLLFRDVWHTVCVGSSVDYQRVQSCLPNRTIA